MVLWTVYDLGTASELLYCPSYLPLEPVVLEWAELVFGAWIEWVLVLGWEATQISASNSVMGNEVSDLTVR